MVIERLKYIAVDGPIGVGKTSLANMLAQDLGARAVYENPDENPFIGNFYEDANRYAFQTQLFFLLSRFRQQTELIQQELFEQKVVCDYVFAKDLVFARLNLSDEEFSLYAQVYNLLDQRLPKPDVVIFLQASPDILMKRIRKRCKDYEKQIEPDYIVRVAQAYSQFYFQYTDSPLLVVNTSGLDFVKHEIDYEMLKKELVALISSGKDKHYVTISPR
ncbi:MAG: deoxynucleoside kinase family protein [uncultured bacterium]|nr:MAG: deoxynucleoside kinase family protein [uncultured bacterium]HLD45060.1 deoxynucleoside kinase [bacterium]